MRPRGEHRRPGGRGFTLVEVMVSMALVTAIVAAATGFRYLTVKQARRADAYNGASKLGQMLLEGWRSSGLPADYDPVTRFGSFVTINLSSAAMAPGAPGGFTTLGWYHVLSDNVHYYVTLAYINATANAPAQLNATVGFAHNYQAVSVATGANYVSLTTYD